MQKKSAKPAKLAILAKPDPAATLVARLTEAGRTIATAESLTGGLVSAELVRIPGASRVFVGGVVAYSVELKQRLLGVDSEVIEQFGTASSYVAGLLAEGARRLRGADRWADIGIATTGTAGPAPEGKSNPGTVFL